MRMLQRPLPITSVKLATRSVRYMSPLNHEWFQMPIAGITGVNNEPVSTFVSCSDTNETD